MSGAMISDEKIGPDKVSVISSGSEKKLRVILKRPINRQGCCFSTCQRLQETLGGSNIRSNIGTCLGVFAVPLLIPGITLTAVAFDDETGFAKYGALHVVGMVMLCVAGIFIILGIVLNINFESKVSPEEAVHSLSTHEKSQKRNLEWNHESQEPQENASHSQGEGSSKDATSQPAVPLTKPQVNFFVESGHDVQRENHVHFNTEKVGALPPIMVRSKQPISLVGVNNGYLSSSDDDSSDDDDTDTRSSGSYILPQEMDVPIPSKENSRTDESQHASIPQVSNNLKDNSSSEFQFRRLGPTEAFVSMSNQELSSPLPPNNFFQDVKRPTNLSLGVGSAMRIDHNKQKIKLREKLHTIPKNTSRNSVDSLKEISNKNCHVKQSSPRARLEGLSNASALASSLQMSNSDELLPKNLGVDNFGSNVSVFSNVEDQKSAQDFTKSFSFDIPQLMDNQLSQDGTISQKMGGITAMDHNRKEYIAKSILKNPLLYNQADGSSQDVFQFQATDDPTTAIYDFFDSQKDNTGPVALKPKKRQAFSFPQGRSSSSLDFPSSTRQSAPPSLLVTAQGSECL